MVVMEAGASVAVCTGSEANGNSAQNSQQASAHHRAWYEQQSNNQDQLDAYFKGYTNFSQMQAGAYPGMSYHGKNSYQ